MVVGWAGLILFTMLLARPLAGCVLTIWRTALPPAKCICCRRPYVNPSPGWLVGPCYMGHVCRPLWAPELPLRFSFLSGQWGCLLVVSFLRKLARESGVEICSDRLDLLSSSCGELPVLPACRRSTLFLPPAGWAVVHAGVSRFLRRPPLHPCEVFFL
jgi:hypothetical protein